MKQERIAGRNGYEIPCCYRLTGGEATAAVILHGFGSSKTSPTAAMLAEVLPERGIGTFAFDFPAHGESPVDGRMLTVEHCLDDLAVCERRVRELSPGAEIVYFGSSFGAYITLIYLSQRPHLGKKAFLRSAAVEMPVLFHDKTPEEEALLARQGYVVLDEGYARPLLLTEEFFADLDAHDLFRICRTVPGPIRMVHGACDETASPEAAKRFAQRYGAELILIEGGDHRLSGEGQPERTAELAVEFFC